MTSLMSDDFSRIRDSFARQSFMQTLQVRLAHIERGRCTLVVPVLASTTQQHGAGHAGVTFTLGDVAAGYAALSMLPEGAEVMTAEIKINLLRPAMGEMLEATGEVLKAGRRLVVVRSDVHAISGGQRALIATLLGTMVPVEP